MHFGVRKNFLSGCIVRCSQFAAGTHLHTQKSTQNRVGYAKFSASRDNGMAGTLILITLIFFHLFTTSWIEMGYIGGQPPFVSEPDRHKEA